MGMDGGSKGSNPGLDPVLREFPEGMIPPFSLWNEPPKQKKTRN